VDTYYISYRTGFGAKKVDTLTAFSYADAKAAFLNMTRVDNNDFFDCTLIKIWKKAERTHKQKLAGNYRWILGNISSAKATLHRTKFFDISMDEENKYKIDRAYALVKNQCSKLERDVRDLFKLTGLKVK
jgi:hypothetical protein